MTNWLEKVVKPNIKPTTLRIYTNNLKNHIAPYFKEMILQELTPVAVDKFMREQTSEGLAKGTLINILILLRHALDYSVYPVQVITSNPAKYNPFGTPMYIPLLFLYHTGMRIGEEVRRWKKQQIENEVELSESYVSKQYVSFVLKREG